MRLADRPYFTLVSIPSKDAPDGWCIEFGDFARSVVRDEMADRKDDDRNTCPCGKRPVYRILAHHGTDQLATVRALNTIEGRPNRL